MSGGWNQRSQSTRLLVYAVVAISLFVLAVGMGAVTALVMSGNIGSPTGERTRLDESSPPGEQGRSAQPKQADAGVSQQQNSGGKRGQVTPQERQTTYVDEVGEIQAGSVEAFLDSHEKLLRYDALTSGDVEKMQANQAALHGFADQAKDLRAPQKYTEQNDAFLSAIDELHQAAQLAYALAADPISATQADFDDYDRLVDEAAADLRKSNKILGKDFKTIDGIHRVGTS
jgi:hypothetical protein